MSIPPVLLSGVHNESQDLMITTDVLEPNVLNSVQAVFVIPKKASVLDSKSALKVRVNWTAWDNNTDADVYGKLFSGLLGLIKNARLYASGQLISDLRHAGEKIHLDNQFKSQEYKENYCDVKHGSISGFRLSDDKLQSGASGSIVVDDLESRTIAAPSVISAPFQFRGIGHKEDQTRAQATERGDDGLEMFLLLEELFPMLKDIQLPVRHLKDEIRIEIDWEQDKTKWLIGTGAALPANWADSVEINNVVMFLDYITYNPEIDSALEQTLKTSGVSIPFRQTAVITKQLAGNLAAETDRSEDVLLGMEGRSVMKVYCAKKYPKVLTGLTGNENQGYAFQGECRSERLLGEKFNMVVNDLLIFDRDVENNHEGYNYLSYAGEKSYTAFPESFEYNDNYGAVNVNNDVLYSTNDAGANDQPILGRAGTIGYVKDGIRGQQNYIGIDLAKFGNKGGDNPMNGMRIGATPIILRIKRTTENNVRTGGAVQLVIFVEYLRLFDLRDGELGIRDL